MFNFFTRRKKSDATNELEAFANQFVRPMALAVSITELLAEHFSSVPNGKVACPIHKMKNPIVQDIWSGLRFEFFRHFFGFGAANLSLLADPVRQQDLFKMLVDERVQYSLPQPTGISEVDTLQAIPIAYLYFAKIGDEVMDRETCAYDLSKRRENILTAFDIEIAKVQKRWADFGIALNNKTPIGGETPIIPPTVLDILFEDVTRKSKSMAISTVFGPLYEGTISQLIESVRKNSDDASAFKLKQAMAKMFEAKEPEAMSQNFGKPSR